MKKIHFNTKARTPRYLILMILFSLSVFNNPTIAEKNPKHIFITGIQNEQTHIMAKAVLQEAYRRIGYNARFELFPGHRSLHMANNGESDGDIARIAEIHKNFIHLVRVPTPVMHFKGVIFTKSITANIREWNDLTGLRIGIIRGIQYAEIGTQGLSPFFAEDMTHLFRLLDQERIQIAIAVSKAGQIELSRNFKKSDIHKIGSVLYSGQLYHYVHYKNQKIVPELNAVLKEMEQQNETRNIIETSFQTLLNS